MMAHDKTSWRVRVAAIVAALGLAACSSDQDVSRTPIGSVVTGNTEPSGYLDQVQQANQNRQDSGQTVSPVGPGSGLGSGAGPARY